MNPAEPRYRIVKRRQSLGHIQWHVYQGDVSVKMFYLKREAIFWIQQQEARP